MLQSPIFVLGAPRARAAAVGSRAAACWSGASSVAFAESGGPGDRTRGVMAPRRKGTRALRHAAEGRTDRQWRADGAVAFRGVVAAPALGLRRRAPRRPARRRPLGRPARLRRRR